jgi:hypothetical protein
MRKGYVFSILLLTVIASLPAVAQTATDDSPGPQEVPRFKILSARFITEAKGMLESSWSIDSAERTGLLVAVEVSFASESLEVKPASFFIEYSLGGGSRFDEECIGLASSAEPKPGDWILIGPGANGFIRRPRPAQGNTSFALLFSVSKKIGEFSLVYRQPAAVVKAVVTK